jgi:hypothetical protein
MGDEARFGLSCLSTVIASVAKQARVPPMTLDCFVAEPVIGPRFARTRWLLAMTASPERKSLNPRYSCRLYSAACCATVGSVPATVARRMSRGWDWS